MVEIKLLLYLDEGAILNKKQAMSDYKSSQKLSKTMVERIVTEATERRVQVGGASQNSTFLYTRL